MAKRRERIRRIFRRQQPNPLDRLWGWAMAGKGASGKAARFMGLERWAKAHAEWARAHEQAGTAEQWAKRRRIYRKKKRFYRRRDREAEQLAATPNSGVTIPDRSWNPNRKPMAAWMVSEVDKVHAAGWGGMLNSGFRTPAHSTQLCLDICGQPTCPGTCAGATSNHAKHVKPEGAIDVSDPSTFGAKARQMGSPLKNLLGAADPFHFSTSGN